MSRSGKTLLEFGPDDQTFRLAFGELVELQEETGKGPGRIQEDLILKNWAAKDITAVLRIGLIGGGMDPTRALAMTRRYCHEVADWENNRHRAYIILSNALQSDEKPGKPQPPERADEPNSQTENGDLQNSTKAPPPPDSTPEN